MSDSQVTKQPIQFLAVVDETGRASLCNATYATLPAGVEIIGIGPLQHPLNVSLTGDFAAATRLADIGRRMYERFAKEMAIDDEINGADAVDYLREMLAEIKEALGIDAGEWHRCESCEEVHRKEALDDLPKSMGDDLSLVGVCGICPDCGQKCYPIPKEELAIAD